MKHGFEQLREIHLDELGAQMHEMVHQKTGLKLLWLEREEVNKTFGIAFPTFPNDDTGVFHIIEHSVLCGSKNYPVKDPFVELLKSSMNTFLNAMTFSDKTFYPISSKNDKDFINLMRVYLDAVFYPSIYSNPECFMQEGWHYEKSEDGSLIYKGVVFNEMKGVYADPDAKLETELSRALYPDNAYGYVSGGDPKSIPQLTYEQFVSTHKKHYSPANAFVILDGKLDIDKVLEIIDAEYLCDIPAGEAVKLPDLQKPVDAGNIEVEYEISPEEEAENRYITAWGRVIGKFDETEKIIALRTLSDVLCGSIQDPLSACVVNEGLAESVSFELSDVVLQPQLTIKAQNVKKEDLDEVENRIFKTLSDLSENGIDKEQLEAALTHLEFQMRENDFGSYPQGLIFGMDILDSWLYGGEPEKNLEVGKYFSEIRNKMDSGYFENLIREAVLDNPHRCKVTMIPSKTVGEEIRREETKKLSEISTSLSKEDWDKIENNCRSLSEWQDTPDSEEAVATLPKLTLDDINITPEKLPTKNCEINGINTLVHTLNSNSIAYVNLYFDVDGCTQEELSALSFASALLGEIATEHHGAQELMNLKRLLCGNIGCTVSTVEKDNSKKCRTFLHMGFSALSKNVEKATSLACEMINSTDFSNTEDIYSILCQSRMELLQNILVSGSQVAMGRTAAQLSPAGVCNECTYGFEYYRWLKSTQENWNPDEFVTEVKDLLSDIISKDRLTLSVTADESTDCEKIAKIISQSIPNNRKESKDKKSLIREWGTAREGIAIPAEVSFAVMTGDMRNTESGLNGHTSVAAKIVSLDYLWTVIRMQGGAYGTGMVVRPNSTVSCYSYRDPSADRSLSCFKECSAHLRALCDNNTDITGFIIGTVADASPVMTPRAKGSLADRLYFRGVGDEDRERKMKEIVSTTLKDLSDTADLLDEIYNSPAVCVVGNKEHLDKCGLDTVLTV